MAFAKEEAELETGHPCKADGGPCSVAKESAIVSGSELRRESVLSVKESWHWLRSNLWVLPLTFTHIWMSAGHSLLQPFFPPLAAAKGIPAWKYGFTFSAIKVSMVFGSIMSEKLIAWTSSKAVYFFGLIGFFLACMSFSLLYWCPTADTLLGGSIAAALFSGFVEGVYLVTLYGTCTSTFLHNTGIIIAIMDCMFGLGSMLGSVIGGALIDFNLSSTGVGTIFMATFASYSVGAIVAGVFCQFKQDAFFEFVGASLATISYLVVGPAPFLPYEPALWLIYLSQVCVGFSCAVLFTCPYYNAYNVALECGYPGTIKTSAFVSSCIFMFQMIGAIITPPLAGYVVEAVGFRNGSMVMFAILLSWLPFTFGLWMDAVRRNKKTPVA
ncbi:uncharacterized protein LOC144098527 isoform X3 [Amblyomma americanum]